MKMSINEILDNMGMTKYRLAKLSGIPHATLSELCSGKTSIEKCSGETLYKIAKALNVSMESLLEDKMTALSRERSYEHGFPSYYLIAKEISKKWNNPVRDWGKIIGQFMMFFEERFEEIRTA